MIEIKRSERSLLPINFILVQLFPIGKQAENNGLLRTRGKNFRKVGGVGMLIKNRKR